MSSTSSARLSESSYVHVPLPGAGSAPSEHPPRTASSRRSSAQSTIRGPPAGYPTGYGEPPVRTPSVPSSSRRSSSQPDAIGPLSPPLSHKSISQHSSTPRPSHRSSSGYSKPAPTPPPKTPPKTSTVGSSNAYPSPRSSATDSSYGELINQPPTLNPQSLLEPTPSAASRPTAKTPLSPTSPRAPSAAPSVAPTPLAAPQRTLDDVRDQVAAGIALRAVRKAEVVDGTKVGVILTLSKREDEKFLLAVSSHVKRLLLMGQYLFAVATEGTPTGGSPPRSAASGSGSGSGSSGSRSSRRSAPASLAAGLLICGSSQNLVHRAVMLACSKFLTRVEEVAADERIWLGLVHTPAAGLGRPGASAYDEAALWDVVRKSALAQSRLDPYLPPPGSRSVEEVLARARAKLSRLSPAQAYGELCHAPEGRATLANPPAVLIDIRPAAQRAQFGGVHGSLVIERNVLEWRLDPRSDARLSIADRYDLRAIVFCQEGYTSSLAAAALQELGLWNATDVVGGYRAWREAGLPTELEVDGEDDEVSTVATSVHDEERSELASINVRHAPASEY